MTKPISESSLRSTSTAKSYERGFYLYRSRAVFDTYKRDNTLVGCCQGNSFPFYQIRVSLDEDGVREANCNCLNEGSGYCKHVIAVLLTYLYQPDLFVEQAHLEDSLQQLDKDALVRIVIQMADKSVDLNKWLQSVVESELAKSKR
jgi:uncharacterized Zn finger protein